jgi:hypothetical protein
MSKFIKYLNTNCRKFDISPCGRYNTVKLLIIISWITSILLFIGFDYFPLESHNDAGTTNYTQQQTDELFITAVPPLDGIKFYRLEIGTVSSCDVIIFPHEIKLIERDRGPPFHIS